MATGSTYNDLSSSFRIDESTICTLVAEVMQIIWKVLCPLHMRIPTKEKLHEIAQDFYLMWDLPHCIGAIDGSHIKIKKPKNSGFLYYSYKKIFSIILQGVVDAQYKFISIDVGGYGHQHDSTTFHNSSFYHALKNRTIILPEDDELPNSDIILPYFFFIGDGAYPLTEYLMKPYPGKNLHAHKRAFNNRLSRARMVVECAFGQVKQRWRIFNTTIGLNPEKCELVVKVTCILHNVIIDMETVDVQNIAEYSTACNDEEQSEIEWEVGPYGKELREELTKFVVENPI